MSGYTTGRLGGEECLAIQAYATGALGDQVRIMRCLVNIFLSYVREDEIEDDEDTTAANHHAAVHRIRSTILAESSRPSFDETQLKNTAIAAAAAASASKTSKSKPKTMSILSPVSCLLSC